MRGAASAGNGEGPSLPRLLADVSHAAGRRDILAPLGRAALAAGAQGVMLEVHPRPEIARSDAQQQLDFKSFDAFLTALEKPMHGLDARAPESSHP